MGSQTTLKVKSGKLLVYIEEFPRGKGSGGVSVTIRNFAHGFAQGFPRGRGFIGKGFLVETPPGNTGISWNSFFAHRSLDSVMDLPLSRAPEPTPKLQRFLALYESMELPELHELSPEQARKREEFGGQDPGIELPTIEEQRFESPGGERTIRLYEPREQLEETAPLVVYFHGGGWVVGSLDSHDGVCRKLAAETGYPVASVEYRLAPEQPFPAGLEDCYAAVSWASEQAGELGADPERLVVAGDSAGANLATAVALLTRDRGGPEIAYQILVYPATGNAVGTKSIEENAEGYFLSRETMAWFSDCYLSDPIDRGNIYALPGRARNLSGLPPATVVTAGFDPLRDDGGRYVAQLREDGVEVSHYHFEAMIHGFFNMIGEPVDLDRAHDAYEQIAADLQSQFS